MTAVASSSLPTDEFGYIGRIPVRNLWLLMLYASDLFRMQGQAAVQLEEMPDHIPDLIAEVLASTVERRLRRHLSLGYQFRTADLNRVRGRIDFVDTDRRRLLSRGLVSCRFETLTIDTKRNRFVKSALEVVSHLARRPDIIHRCRALASALLSLGVSAPPPTLREMKGDRFGSNDMEDQFMVAAARLVFDLALPTQALGTRPLPLPDREETWVRKLFERAVGGFFTVVLPVPLWKVSTGNHMNWQITSKTAGVDQILPGMRTDIILDDTMRGRRIVIDTKFTSILTGGWYRDQTIRSGYVYQLYSYLQSQVGRGDSAADTAEGVLLHPSVGRAVDESATIQSHRIRFMTVDLTGDTSAIRSDLLKVFAVVI